VIWRRGLPYWRVTDCIAPALAIGQAIGRVGCQLAGDGDWGQPTMVPWGMSFPNAIIGWEQWTRENGLPIDVRVHPAPVYETILYGLAFAVLWRRRLTPHPDGYILWMYFLLSGAARFLVEIVRINPRIAFGLSEAQFISLAIMAIGAVQIWRSSGAAMTAASAATPSEGRRAS
jgi:phosphatidylglycerol:prolipoprotein diacylglycerol transferase